MGSTHPVAQQRPLWRNIDGSDCGVEELALSYYGTLGYRGYHSENSILSTLFGLLFWDILFYPQPGVFETLYQTEPLDLRTDAFFIQRQDMIMERIENIAKSTVIDGSDALSVAERSSSAPPSASVSSAVKEEFDGVDEDEPLMRRRSTRKAEVMKPVDQTLMESILFEDEIRQELEEDDDSEERQAQRARDEFLAKKRRACFYLNLLGTHDDMYREKGVFCVGVNWTFTKEELLQIAEVYASSFNDEKLSKPGFLSNATTTFNLPPFISALAGMPWLRYARFLRKSTASAAPACLIYGTLVKWLSERVTTTHRCPHVRLVFICHRIRIILKLADACFLLRLHMFDSCWNYEKKLVKFVEGKEVHLISVRLVDDEYPSSQISHSQLLDFHWIFIVKGPGDRLSSKQQVWIDLLTSLHVDIELCIVQVSKAEDAFLEERAAFN